MKKWNGNLQHIPDILQLARVGDEDHPPVHWPGLTRPFLYLGPEGTAFSYHKEDVSIYYT